MTDCLDLEHAWAKLSPEQQRRLGMATIAEYVSLLAAGLPPQTSGVRWDGVLDEVETAIIEILEDVGVLIPGEAEQVAQLPNLNQLGVRMCLGCGCTDDHGCEEGCY